MIDPEAPGVPEPESGREPLAHILLVEDNEWVQNYVRKIFRGTYEVHLAGDGVEALRHLKEEANLPELVILDIMMPRMDGNECFRRIKENPDWAHIPIMMFSALSSEEERLDGLERGADEYIGKPFNPRELRARAANLLKMRRQEVELIKLNEELEDRVQAQVDTILTERERYESELIQAKEVAEESDKLKSFILRNMSHEIRTPITNILGFAEILGERVEKEDRQFAAYIESNGRRLLDTVTTILDFSKLTSGTFPMRPHEADLATIARDAADRFRTLAGERGLQIVHQVEQEQIPMVVDRAAVDTMLNHILGNAIKFTPQGSVIVRAGTEGEYGWVEVEDTGIGIADAFIAELFSPFKQESEGDARTFEGTGLGLSICQRLMHLMEGRIEVSSRKGEGSAFTIFLPLGSVEKTRRDRGPLSHADIIEASERVQSHEGQAGEPPTV